MQLLKNEAYKDCAILITVEPLIKDVSTKAKMITIMRRGQPLYSGQNPCVLYSEVPNCYEILLVTHTVRKEVVYPLNRVLNQTVT